MRIGCHYTSSTNNVILYSVYTFMVTTRFVPGTIWQSNLIKPVALCLTYVQCVTLVQHRCLHSAVVITTSGIRSHGHEGDIPEYFAVLFGHDRRPCYQNAWRLYSPILDKRTREHLPTPTGTSHLWYLAKKIFTVLLHYETTLKKHFSYCSFRVL